MPGAIAPDGRPPQAPGVGKDAKRHDLEAPATPGVRSSDMQQGDRQKLEAAQKIAPRPQKGTPQGGGSAPAQSAGGMQVPDPIEFAGQRMGGNVPAVGAPMRQVDSSAWKPLVERLAYAPNGGGALAANLTDALTQFVRRPVVSEVSFVDLDGVDRLLGE